jgi:Ca2+-binding RTX toxin-like protein
VPTTATDATAPTEPLVITGTPAAAGNPYTALVIDTRGLPSGTVIQLQNVEFAAVIGAVRVTGGEGSQNVWGDGAAQYIVLGADDDTLHGGGGADYVGSRTGNDILFGDTGADTVTGGEDADIVYGNQQDDAIYGNLGSDTLYGGQDWDTVFGGQDGDIAYGNRGDDVVYGNKGADTLFGGQANDTLFGGQSDDVLFGKTGDDVLTGGLGADLFAFHGGSGADLITDFSFADGDRLFADGRSWTVSDGAAGAIINFGAADKVTLANIKADQVTNAWFTMP